MSSETMFQQYVVPARGPSTTFTVSICVDVKAMGARAAVTFLDSVESALASRGIAFIGISGGSLPTTLGKALSDPALLSRIQGVQWSSVHMFLVDERCVKLDHADR